MNDTIQKRRPFNTVYPTFAGIYQLEASANSHYDSLQILLRRRFSKGLTLYASHVWSHSIDDASNGFCSCTAGVSLPQNSFDTRSEKGVSAFDQRQRFTLTDRGELDRSGRARAGILAPGCGFDPGPVQHGPAELGDRSCRRAPSCARTTSSICSTTALRRILLELDDDLERDRSASWLPASCSSSGVTMWSVRTWEFRAFLSRTGRVKPGSLSVPDPSPASGGHALLLRTRRER